MASTSQQQPPPPPPPDPAIPTIPSQPSDIELAKTVLRALVDPSASSPAGNTITIHDADVYAHDPADLTRQFAATVAEDGQKAWYLSTKLEPKSHRGKRKRRCTKSGVWHDEGKSKPIVGSQARRYLFSFLNKDGDRTGWIMHEFRLPDGNEESLVVLCKVFRSSRWCAPNPAISATAEAQAQAQAEVRVVAEALVKALEEREAAVRVKEEALSEREAAVEAREAEAARWDLKMEAIILQFEAMWDAAEVDAAWRREIMPPISREEQVRMYKAAREAAREARLPEELAAWRALLQAREGRALAWRELLRPREEGWEDTWQRDFWLHEEFEPRFAQLTREPVLAREPEVREAEGEGLARREEARLEVSERNLQDLNERDLTPLEQIRYQEIMEGLVAEVEALVLILMAARAGLLLLLLLPIAGGSKAAVSHCGLELSRSMNVNVDKVLCLKFCIKESSVEI